MILRARNLLQTVHVDITANGVPANIEWIFCHRETGDAPADEEYIEREKFFDLAASLDIPVATLSHVKFMPELRKRGLAESRSPGEPSSALEEWRNLFGIEVMRTIAMLPSVDIVIMAGYMLIIGNPELEGMDLVNIHPALPWGPKGTWQEVIHQLIAEEAAEQGIMVHLVTKDLDQRPGHLVLPLPHPRGRMGSALGTVEAGHHTGIFTGSTGTASSVSQNSTGRRSARIAAAQRSHPGTRSR